MKELKSVISLAAVVSFTDGSEHIIEFTPDSTKEPKFRVNQVIRGEEVLEKTAYIELPFDEMIVDSDTPSYWSLVKEVRRLNNMIDELIVKESVDVCSRCSHYVGCEGKNCPQYITGTTATINGREVQYNWTCEHFDWGDCPRLENTPCFECIQNDCKGFSRKDKLNF